MLFTFSFFILLVVCDTFCLFFCHITHTLNRKTELRFMRVHVMLLFLHFIFSDSYFGNTVFLLHSRSHFCEYVWRRELFFFVSLGELCYCFYIYPSLLLWLSVRISFSCYYFFFHFFLSMCECFSLVCSCSLSGFGIIVWYFWFVFFFFIFSTNFFAKLSQYPLLLEDDLCVCVCFSVWFGVTSLCESDKRRKRTFFVLL